MRRLNDMIKKYFKGWNLFEKIWLGLIFIFPIVFSILFKSSVIECITTITYLLSAILVSKGKHDSYPIGIVSLILYAYVSFGVGYYGEIIISIVLLLPTMIIGLISWIKNKRVDEKQGDVVVVNKVSRKEISLLILSQIVLGGGYYFLLKAFDTNFLVVSTISIITSAIATYLLARRSEYGLPAFVVNDVILVILWTTVVIQGNVNFITILLTPAMLLISDVYGTINWQRLKKSQNIKGNK